MSAGRSNVVPIGHVTIDVVGPEPEQLLASAVPSLILAEQILESMQRLVDQQTKRLARKRKVAFIRPEHIRREFGGGNGAQV